MYVFIEISLAKNFHKTFFNYLSFQIIWEYKTGRGLIPDRGSCPLSTQLTEDRLRRTSGPVQPSVPLHLFGPLDMFYGPSSFER